MQYIPTSMLIHKVMHQVDSGRQSRQFRRVDMPEAQSNCALPIVYNPTKAATFANTLMCDYFHSYLIN